MRKWDRFFLFSWCLSLVCFLFTITGEIHWRIGGRNKIEVAYIHDFSIIVYVLKFHTRFEESPAKLKMLNAAKFKLERFLR